MKIGLHLPQLAHHADPEASRRVAEDAEAGGFSSLWVIDRLLSPVAPRSRYPATEDGLLPPVQSSAALDPLLTLTVAATHTEQIRVGTAVLVAPWYPPALLARSLATLDRVSRGRLDVGLGLGWSLDEYDAVGAAMSTRGRRLEEVIEVLRALWGDGATEVRTSREWIARSTMGVKPVQSPPPLLLGAYTPAGLDRVGRLADGWLPAGLPLDVMAAMWSTALEAAERQGRDPLAMRLVVRADVKITERPLGADRGPFVGTERQVADDIARCRELGAHEVVLDLQAATRDATELMELARSLSVDHAAAAAA